MLPTELATSQGRRPQIDHRLNRGGDRAAYNALWTIAHIRMISDPRTRAYVAKRTAIGNSGKEITRLLQRYIAREQYPPYHRRLPPRY